MGNAFWRTDLTISNWGALEAQFTLKFLGNNQDGRSGPEHSYVLGVGQAITFNDVLQSVFEIPNGFGALLLSSVSSSLSMLGQTYTPGAGGTYGQTVPAACPHDWISEGTPNYILAVRQDAAFRTNLILANTTQQLLDVDVVLVNDQGDILGQKRYTLFPLGMTQVVGIIGDLGWKDPIGSAHLRLATPTPGGSFSAYAAVIDNVTNDPRTLLPSPGSGWLLPSSARVPGIGNAFWSTRVTISNRGESDSTVLMKFLGNNADGREGTERTVELQAGRSLTFNDVLGSLFGIDSGFGAIAMTPATATLLMASQTTTPGNGGTFGQSVPAVATHDLITCATPGSISGIREDASFRTNLILANASEFSVDVEVTLVNSDGQTSASRQYRLFPKGMTQVTQVVRTLGITDSVVGDRLVLVALTPGGAFAAYASVIDNVTNDPRTLLPSLHRQFLAEATVFAGGLFSNLKLCGITFTPENRTLYLGNIGSAGLEILTSKLENGVWTAPVVAEFSKRFNGRSWDFNPRISPDGSKLFFASGRPISGSTIKDDDIWVMDRIENRWSEPQNLGSPVNTTNHEYLPTVTSDGTLYFARLGDILRSKLIAGKYSAPEKLGYPINTGSDDFSPFVTPDENLLLFSSDRPGGFGGYDLYASRRNNKVWSTPQNLGPKVNSSTWERYPTLSPDGKSLFFIRDREGLSDFEIFQIDASVLGLD